MNEIPDVPSPAPDPKIAPSEDGRRLPAGWIILALILGFLIVSQLVQYFSPERKEVVGDVRIAQDLKGWVRKGPSINGVIGKDVLARDLEAIQRRPKWDAGAALLYAQLSTELGRRIDLDRLATMKVSDLDRVRLAYEIYASDPLTKDRAKAIVAKLPKDKFVYRLAAVQALEKAGLPSARDDLEGGISQGVVIVIGLLGLAFGALAIALIFAYGAARACGHLQPLGFPMGRQTPPQGDRLALAAAQFFLIFFVASLLPLVIPEVASDYSDALLYVVMVAGFVWVSTIAVRGRKFDLKTLGLSRENLGTHILWGAGAAIANIPFLVVLGLLGNYLFGGLPTAQHPVTMELEIGASWLTILKLGVIASIAAPFTEELMFRATLFPALSAVLKSPLAGGIVSSLLFAAIHPTGIPAWLPLAGIGGMSCFLVYQTKSIVPSMIMHGIHNGATLAMVLLISR